MTDEERQRWVQRLEDDAVVDRLVRDARQGRALGREALARDLGVPAECVALSASLEDLTVRAVASVLDPGEVLALAEPCRESWLRGALACGGRYLDMGRDHALRPLASALGRALDDGGVAALLLEHPTVLGGGTVSLPVDEFEGPEPFLFVDQSASSVEEVAVDHHVLHLGQRGPLAWAVGTPERVAALHRTERLEELSERPRVHPEALMEALEGSGLEVVTPPGIALLVRLAGGDAETLLGALHAHGIAAKRRAHPSWRQTVALVGPVQQEGDLLRWRRSVDEAIAQAQGGKVIQR
jgi:hypothetical protein